WLDNSLQFFAAIDIILTAIILVDSGLQPGWLIFIGCLVMIVFSWVLTFTVIFNRNYHSLFNNKYKQYLKDKLMLPFRKVNLPYRVYKCRKCGEIVDHITSDFCGNCGAPILKCEICGDVIEIKDEKETLKQEMEDEAIQKLTESIGREIFGQEAKKAAEVEREIQCPFCQKWSHADEFMSWIKLRGKTPCCKKKFD
ncbi:MAG: hypothetical protein ACTSRA_13705, partial [Promethearchaeota archaeon]